MCSQAGILFYQGFAVERQVVYMQFQIRWHFLMETEDYRHREVIWESCSECKARKGTVLLC